MGLSEAIRWAVVVAVFGCLAVASVAWACEKGVLPRDKNPDTILPPERDLGGGGIEGDQDQVVWGFSPCRVRKELDWAAGGSAIAKQPIHKVNGSCAVPAEISCTTVLYMYDGVGPHTDSNSAGGNPCSATGAPSRSLVYTTPVRHDIIVYITLSPPLEWEKATTFCARQTPWVVRCTDASWHFSAGGAVKEFNFAPAAPPE